MRVRNHVTRRLACLLTLMFFLGLVCALAQADSQQIPLMEEMKKDPFLASIRPGEYGSISIPNAKGEYERVIAQNNPRSISLEEYLLLPDATSGLYALPKQLPEGYALESLRIGWAPLSNDYPPEESYVKNGWLYERWVFPTEDGLRQLSVRQVYANADQEEFWVDIHHINAYIEPCPKEIPNVTEYKGLREIKRCFYAEGDENGPWHYLYTLSSRTLDEASLTQIASRYFDTLAGSGQLIQPPMTAPYFSPIFSKEAF